MKPDADWKSRFDEKFVVTSNAGTPLLRYTDAGEIKVFIERQLTAARADERKRMFDAVMKTYSEMS